MLSRPGLAQVLAYREHVNAALLELLSGGRLPPEVNI